ncbi:MAG TPA: ATP-grasp domain-containing protein [Vicinamibacterales bacterium]|nr:ATP-grasp domain-containing protein [Vicinamibacterales bacterium]
MRGARGRRRILVHEFASGGGFAGRPVPPSLAREGAAMVCALVADLAAIGRYEIITTADARFRLSVPTGVRVVSADSGKGGKAGKGALTDELIASVDAVWLIAPESNRCLERLTARVERIGTPVLGSGSEVIGQAADKAGLARTLRQRGISHPGTVVLSPGRDPGEAAGALGYPVVIKPRRGAGCCGVALATKGRQLRQAVDEARCGADGERLLIQRYIEGTPASVSLVVDGCRAVPLALNAQTVSRSRTFSYRGGRTPLDHPRASQAIDTAVETCLAFPGLRGYVGVDLVMTPKGACVIEVNPRLTTAYLGLRAAFDENIAELVIAACGGSLPSVGPPRRRVRFSSAGRLQHV